jgi:hypothetical protein
MDVKVPSPHIVARDREVAHTNARQSVAQVLSVEAVTERRQAW